MRISKIKKIAITIAIIIVINLATFKMLQPLLKAPDYPAPTGKYDVGTTLFIATDNNRDETLSESYMGKRRVAVRAYYPAIKKDDSKYLPVDDKRVMDALSEMYGMPVVIDENFLSNSIIDGEAIKGKQFPVIIFSHGGMSYNTQNFTTMEELASRGYIVLAVSHLYESVASIMSETEVIYSEQTHIADNMNLITDEEHLAQLKRLEQLKENITDSQKVNIHKEIADKYYKDMIPMVKVRIDDMLFLADYLKVIEQNNTLPFANIMDTTNIGVFGHSLGGMTAQYACSDPNTPFKAGISMDITAYIFDERPNTLQTPFAFFYSSQSIIGSAGKVDITGTNSFFEDNSTHDVYSLRFEGTGHNNFLDANLMPPIFKLLPDLALGEIDGGKMLNILNKSIADYFDYNLKGETNNIYGTISPAYEEISITKK